MRQLRSHRVETQSQSLASQELPSLQLELPGLESGVPSQNHERLKAKRQRRSRGLPATNPATLGRRDTELDPFPTNKRKKIEGQRFSLTSPISTIITNVNGNRWLGHVTALPPFTASTEPEPRSGCAHVGKRGPGMFPPNPLERYEGRAGLPALRLHGRLHLQDARAVQVQSL